MIAWLFGPATLPYTSPAQISVQLSIHLPFDLCSSLFPSFFSANISLGPLCIMLGFAQSLDLKHRFFDRQTASCAVPPVPIGCNSLFALAQAPRFISSSLLLSARSGQGRALSPHPQVSPRSREHRHYHPNARMLPHVLSMYPIHEMRTRSNPKNLMCQALNGLQENPKR